MERFTIRVGQYGCYFYDTLKEKDVTLEEALFWMNDYMEMSSCDRCKAGICSEHQPYTGQIEALQREIKLLKDTLVTISECPGASLYMRECKQLAHSAVEAVQKVTD